jgi:uncharacterized membrane protein HdeD (DUF308 family)
MASDFEDKKLKAYSNRRAIMDYGMGILYFGVGIFFFVSDRFGFEIDFPEALTYTFGGLCIIYGVFRIYRGYKKNYFR